MEATQKHTIQDGSSMFYHQPSVKQMDISVQTFDSYCTLESSSGTKSHPCPNNNITSSTTSFSSNGSPVSHSNTNNNTSHLSPDNNNSPLSGSSATNNNETELTSSGSSIYKALRCKDPTGPELLTYMHILYEACPYFKFGYESANGAIAEAVKNESFVHIIDFQISQGGQWVSLIRALGARPGGPPRVRITGIDDPRSSFARQGGLELVGQRLGKLAEMCGVPFEFHGAALCCTEVEIEKLGVRNGEALAVNFPLVLHHMPDESVTVENHRDRLLRLVKRLSPNVVTLVEQEANTNTAPFLPRFVETMNHYLAVFESIDVKLARDHKERINVEQHCLAREVVNLIACEGVEREERHEPLGKWRSRFHMAGFKPYPLSSYVNATIKGLLESYSEKYTLEERDGALYLGWKNQPLITSCAWR
ncbi:BnaA06g02700D [Brassica napus]|uniref:BnaA06g02700D protein n=1 Tax=Brassica napus TaxID=3708 RepID=A0A078GCM1_BRANA|nr:BnaA06g02700D [Brassica napus]